MHPNPADSAYLAASECPPSERLPDSEEGLYNHVAIQLETQGLTSHRVEHQPDELFSKRDILARSIVAKLRAIKRLDLVEPLEKCHTDKFYRVCGSCHKSLIVWNRCDLGYCPVCQPRLSRDRRDNLAWWVNSIKAPKHVVLTFKNVLDLSRDYLKSCKDALARLRRMKFARNWSSGIYSMEITNEGRGWHVHFHLLVDSPYIDARILSQSWAKATDDASYIVKVKAVQGKDYLREVAKYAVKGTDLASWCAGDIACFIDAVSGLRMFGVFGELYGKRTEWKQYIEELRNRKVPCTCGCTDFAFLSSNEWELFQATGRIPKPGFAPPCNPVGHRPATSDPQRQFQFVL